MDILKNILENLETATYEILAVILPGAAFVESLRWMWHDPPARLSIILGDTPGLAYLAFAYVAGMAMQGLSNLLFGTKWMRDRIVIDRAVVAELRARCVALLPERVRGGAALSDRALLGICLSHLGDKRRGYERFSALRDMARGLCLAAFVAFCMTMITWQSGREKNAVAVALLLAFLGLLERYIRYAPLADEVVYSQVIAVEMGKKAEPPGSKDGEERPANA